MKGCLFRGGRNTGFRSRYIWLCPFSSQLEDEVPVLVVGAALQERLNLTKNKVEYSVAVVSAKPDKERNTWSLHRVVQLPPQVARSSPSSALATKYRRWHKIRACYFEFPQLRAAGATKMTLNLGTWHLLPTSITVVAHIHIHHLYKQDFAVQNTEQQLVRIWQGIVWRAWVGDTCCSVQCKCKILCNEYEICECVQQIFFWTVILLGKCHLPRFKPHFRGPAGQN